jgi:tripeptidyl-peptidase-1
MKLLSLISLAGLVVREVSASPLFGHDVDIVGDELPQTKRSVPETHIQHEKRTDGQERRWVKLQRADPHAKLPVRIGLKQRNLQEGHDLLMDMCVVSPRGSAAMMS